jgi:hypothetical protein
MEKREKARLLSVTAPHSSRWLQVVPTEPDLRLTDLQYHWAARLRLGLSVPATADGTDSDSCDSCRRLGVFKADSWHHLSCVHHRGAEVTDRHHAVVDCVARHARMAGARCRVEPTRLSERDRTRPDLKVLGPQPNRDLLIDVSITHPLAPSHLDVAVRGSLAGRASLRGRSRPSMQTWRSSKERRSARSPARLSAACMVRPST